MNAGDTPRSKILRFFLCGAPARGGRFPRFFAFYAYDPTLKRSEVMTMGVEERDKLVEKERERLKKIFKDIPPNKLKVVDGLITQAARLRVLLDELWIDISENGDYELFTQSEKVEPYERERPAAKLYNTRDQTYQRVIKQLTDLLPEEKLTPETKRSIEELL